MNSSVVQKIEEDGFAKANGPSQSLTPEIAVANIVKKELGVEVTGFEPILGRGVSNSVFIVATEEGRYVVRLNQPGRLINFEKEAWCLERAHEQGVLVPRVIAVGREGDHSYSIAKFVELSTPIHDGLDKIKLWGTLGGYAAKLNSIGESSHTNPEQFKEWFGTWPSNVNREIGIIFRDNFWVESGFLSSEELQSIESRFEKFAATDFRIGVCHWDIGLDNCIYAEKQLYMLDLEFAMLAPMPHYQLAVVGKTWGFESAELKAFSTGYGIDGSQMKEISDDLKCIAAFLRMRSVRWAQDRAPSEVEGRLKDSKAAVFDLLEGLSK